VVTLSNVIIHVQDFVLKNL